MKTLITIILTALLAACGDCHPELEPTPVATPVIVTPEPVVQTPEPVQPPKPEPIVTAPVVTPEPITACPQSTATVCAPSPIQIPVRPIVIEPNPEPICVRNSEPLVLVNGTLTDNCGNKYGVVLK